MAKFDKIIVLSNGTEWCRYCWKGALNRYPITFYNNQLPVKSKKMDEFLQKLFLRFSFLRPLLSFYFYILLGIKKNEKTLVIVYDWNILTKDPNFMRRIRKDCKLVYLFSNIVKITGATKYNILNTLKDEYDMIFAFDKEDSEKYGFNYHRLIYEKPQDLNNQDIKYDLFYVGQAKDRLGKLLEIFEKAESCGLKCDFHIVGVPENQQKHNDKIEYNVNMPYEEAVKHICSSRCLVDAIQGESTGLTIKTCEAVVFNKKLITTNEHVRAEKFYNPSDILIYNEQNNNLDQFLKNEDTEYTDNDRYVFSVESLLNGIYKEME